MTEFKHYHAKRLLKLAAFLRELPPEKLDLNSWVREGNPVKDKCSAVACAFGWAAAIPSFRRAGLRLHPDNDGILWPHYRDTEGYEAAAEFFGLKSEEHAFLFSSFKYPESHQSAYDVANRIERLVERKQREQGNR